MNATKAQALTFAGPVSGRDVRAPVPLRQVRNAAWNRSHALAVGTRDSPGAAMTPRRTRNARHPISATGRALFEEALTYERQLRHILLRFTHNEADVEDVLQQLYTKLLTAAPASTTNTRGYIFTAAYHCASQWLDSQKLIPFDTVADLAALNAMDPGPRVERIIEDHQELEALVRAVRQLPARQREVFVLKKVYGFSQEEIGQRMGIAISTVERQINLATRNLAHILGTQQVLT